MRTARTLSPGQPDRTCDIVAESILDEYLHRDPETSARLRVMGGRGALFVSGVISTKADFDVGGVITRAAASLGVRGHVEPFVSIDAIPGSFLLEATRSNRPISVTGYACRETEERLPSTVILSRRMAKHLEDLRQHDPEWFWLEPSFEVTVTEKEKGAFDAYVTCAHGDVGLKDARERIKRIITSKFDVPPTRLHVNEHGSMPSNGLDQDVGASGLTEEPYGNTIPWTGFTVGTDPSNPSKFGAWLARGLAKRALERSDAKAVLVQATYLPGDREPSALLVRDERGRDGKQDGDGEAMAYAALRPHIRPALSTNAAHWGFAGEVEMPWEQ